MATRTSVGSGNWSVAGTWDTGVPIDGDTVVIAEGHAVLMDVDQSAWTGLGTGSGAAVTITSSATPGNQGMLYWKNGTNGYLKIRSGSTIIGTNAANKGRILVNSDGVWANNGALQFSNTAVLDFQGTAYAAMQYLEAKFYCTQPTQKWVRTYGTSYDVVASGSTVDTTLKRIDLGTTAPTEGTQVRVTALAGGTLPAPLLEDHNYWVRNPSGNWCQLASRNADMNLVDLTSVGSGTFRVYQGHTNTSTNVVNILEDVTGEDYWNNGEAVVLTNENNSSVGDTQRLLTISAISATQITLSANVDSAQAPGSRIWLTTRNVAVRSTYATASQFIFDYSGNGTGTGIFQCEGTQTGGSNTAYYNYFFRYGTGHVFSGVYTGWNQMCGTSASRNYDSTFSGIFVGNGSVADYCFNATFSGYFCGFYASSSNTGIQTSNMYCTVSGEVIAGYYGVSAPFSTVTGLVRDCTYGVSGSFSVVTSTGVVRGCSTAINGHGCRFAGVAYANTNVVAGSSVVTGTLDYLSHESNVVYPNATYCGTTNFNVNNMLRGVRHMPSYSAAPATGRNATFWGSAPAGTYPQHLGASFEHFNREAGESLFLGPMVDVRRRNTADWFEVIDQRYAGTAVTAANIRNTVPANLAPFSGTKIRVWFTPNDHVKIVGASIGEMSSGNTFDATPTRITFNGGQNGIGYQRAAKAFVSDPIDFTFDRTKRYGIHIACDSTVGAVWSYDNLNSGHGYYTQTTNSDMTMDLTFTPSTTQATRTAGITVFEVFNNPITRTGGASSMLEVTPLTALAPATSLERAWAIVTEWKEADVPASQQTRTVYLMGKGWTGFPENTELYLEADYTNADFEPVLIASTQVLSANLEWTAFSVTFTPGIVGPVRYRIILTKWENWAKIYVDGALY